MKKLLVSMALGAALAWLFDPDAGSRRRDSVRSRLEKRGLGSASSPTPQPATGSTFSSATSPSSVDNGAAAPTVASIP